MHCSALIVLPLAVIMEEETVENVEEQEPPEIFRLSDPLLSKLSLPWVSVPSEIRLLN